MEQNNKKLRAHLIRLLEMKGAHVDFEKAVTGIPRDLRGKVPEGVKHSAWDILEHIRIAQNDILDFVRNPDYEYLNWPDDYWPKDHEPPDDMAWDESIKAFMRDTEELMRIASDESNDLLAEIPHGEGQTLLREILLVSDHSAYHLGEIVLLRRILGVWD